MGEVDPLSLKTNENVLVEYYKKLNVDRSSMQ